LAHGFGMDVGAHHAGALGCKQFRGRTANANVNVVIITHECQEANLLRALKLLQANAALVEPPHMMRIENLK